ncbi:hypothetical protein GF312_12830 [Candidatus Poribacteria bacterium]|nr:hypothetical protein [Candidatus Poribacteria bacterium]
MKNHKCLPKWSPRVRRDKIKHMYQLDAQGILDEELINQVAYAFYARCKSVLTVTKASRGRVECPECGNIIPRRGHDKEQLLKCDNCPWHITWGEYFKSYHRKQLHGGGAVDVFEDYIKRFPAAKTLQDKMILMDWIIHECHKGLIEGECNRPVAVNLISGNMTQVIELLEELAYGSDSISSEELHNTWCVRLNEAMRRWGMRSK